MNHREVAMPSGASAYDKTPKPKKPKAKKMSKIRKVIRKPK
jgi:hypothetical protein